MRGETCTGGPTRLKRDGRCITTVLVCLLAGDHAIDDADRAMGVDGHFRIVRHEDHRDAFRIESLKHAENLDARLRIEIAGRLVSQDQRRTANERPGDRYPLLLPT